MTDAGGSRILVVDDEPGIVRFATRVLRSGGYEIEAFLTGETALAALAIGRFDVILSDIALPDLSGVELLREVRRRDLDIPVVLMTGSPSVATAIDAIELGAFRYLTKPFLPEVLRDVVAQAEKLARLARLKRAALVLLGDNRYLVGDRAGLEATFLRALAALHMVYQPIVSWPRGAVFAHEALVRSGEAAMGGPAELLDAAERLHRLPDLGRAVRREVAERMDRAPPSETIFVNLHSHDLLDEMLYAESEPLSGHAGHVILEITERSTLEGVPDVRGRIERLRKMGYALAIDDLGAGYAGLTSFAALEPDVVKLDMLLVRDIARQPIKRKLVRSMVGLCRELGQRVIAEGVETVEERDVLGELGCELMQGFLFGRPS